jgi:cbb3-type cytochrome oxidase subunit 1
VTSADTMSAPDTDATNATRLSPVARVLAGGALLFLVAGLVLLLAAVAGVAWPESGLGEYLSYGRAMPAALNALVFGWLTLGLLAVVHETVPRLARTEPAMPAVSLGAGLLAFVATAVGVGAILAGEGVGGRLLEMPWFVDAALVVAYLTIAFSISSTIARSEREETPVALWYLGVGPWMLALSYAAGAIPGFVGAPAEIQSAFSATAVYGLWLAPTAIGGGYHLISRLVPGASFHPRLGRIGFWSLGFTWAWTMARTLQYGPMPDWMETIPVVFSLGLLVAMVAIVADFAFALRGRWDAVSDSIPLQFYAVGTAFFVLVPVQMVLQSFRASSGVIRFTAWEVSFEYLTLLGAFSLWTAGLVSHLAGSFHARGWGRGLARLAVVPAAAGVVFAVVTRWIAGLQQGYTWLGGVQAGTHENYGDGFRNTVAFLQGTEQLTFIGLAVGAFGLLVFAVGAATGLANLGRRGQFVGSAIALAALVVVAFTTAAPVGGTEIIAVVSAVVVVVGALVFVAARAGAGEVDRVDVEFEWPDTEEFGTIRRGAAAVFILSVLVVFALPAYEIGAEPTLLADRTRSFESGSAQELGRELYVAEGCWYCHTQQVRAIVTDVGLGPVSVPGDYAYDPAGIFGVQRIGPDLAHAGSREPTDTVSWIADHLRDPRSERPWSTMPAYDHLSDGELAALATYVAGLE